MKKMMIIAVMISAMLMPAQMKAQNNRDNRPRVENNRNDRFDRPGNNRPAPRPEYRPNNRPAPRPDYRPDYRPQYRPQRPAPVVVVNRPAPRPCPPPPPAPRVVYYDNNPVVEATSAFLSIVGLMAIMAD